MDSTLVSIICSVTATLFGLLALMIGWIGSRVVHKQDELLDKMDLLKDELHERIHNLGLRIVKVEAKVGIYK